MGGQVEMTVKRGGVGGQVVGGDDSEEEEWAGR